MKTRAQSLIVFVFMLFMAPAFGAVTIMGARSCGDWIKEKQGGETKGWTRLAQESWLTGFLSGMAASSGKDAMRGVTGTALFAWMDNYCQANPLDDIDDGGAQLFQELSKRKGL